MLFKFKVSLLSKKTQLKTLQYTNKVVVVFSKKTYNTGYSQAVTHPSTNPAQHCLTSMIRRELVLSVWYGHRQFRA